MNPRNARILFVILWACMVAWWVYYTYEFWKLFFVLAFS